MFSIPHSPSPIPRLLPGDWLVLCAGSMLVAWLFAALWGGGAGERLVIKRAGVEVVDAALNAEHRYRISGPLGTTEVEVSGGRARVARDPGPRQLCVRQGWISRAGEASLCLPNQVSVEIRGAARAYDSLNY